MSQPLFSMTSSLQRDLPTRVFRYCPDLEDVVCFWKRCCLTYCLDEYEQQVKQCPMEL